MAKAVDVCTVSNIGQATGYETRPLYTGRGYEAPMAGSTVHKSGSQGKH